MDVDIRPKLGKVHKLYEFVISNKEIKNFLHYFGKIVAVAKKGHIYITDIDVLFNGDYEFICEGNYESLDIKKTDLSEDKLFKIVDSGCLHNQFCLDLQLMVYRVLYKRANEAFAKTEVKFPIQFTFCAIVCAYERLTMSNKTAILCLKACRARLLTMQFWINFSNSNCRQEVLHLYYT